MNISFDRSSAQTASRAVKRAIAKKTQGNLQQQSLDKRVAGGMNTTINEPETKLTDIQASSIQAQVIHDY